MASLDDPGGEGDRRSEEVVILDDWFAGVQPAADDDRVFGRRRFARQKRAASRGHIRARRAADANDAMKPSPVVLISLPPCAASRARVSVSCRGATRAIDRPRGAAAAPYFARWRLVQDGVDAPPTPGDGGHLVADERCDGRPHAVRVLEILRRGHARKYHPGRAGDAVGDAPGDADSPVLALAARARALGPPRGGARTSTSRRESISTPCTAV